MSIILIGYRGSGKTSVGKKLAELRQTSFADSDDQIVQTAGQTIREIFEIEGESGFRDRETAAIRQLLDQDIGVISLGGGAVLRPENQEMLLAAGGHRIYLSCRAEELFRRIHSDPATGNMRPALTTLGGGIDEIQSLLARRDPIYKQIATITLDVTHLTVEQVVDRLKSI